MQSQKKLKPPDKPWEEMMFRNKPLSDPLFSVIKEPGYVQFVNACAALVIAKVKKAGIHHLQGKQFNIDAEIESVMLQVWNNGYNHGLSHMDKAHVEANRIT